MNKSTRRWLCALMLASSAFLPRAGISATVPPVTTIYLNTAVEVLKNSAGKTVLEPYCVVTGPGGTIDYAGDCETVRHGLAKDMVRKYPTALINYVVDGESWNTI